MNLGAPEVLMLGLLASPALIAVLAIRWDRRRRRT